MSDPFRLEGNLEAAPGSREFTFSDRHFKFLREQAMKLAGITLSDAKRELVYGRIARRIRALKLDDFDAYCTLLEHHPEGELGSFINAMTTNLTAFFREDHHFKFLRETLVPHWMKTRGADPRLKVWSAGCSTGEEPYSIAITLLEALPTPAACSLEIIASDIDTDVLATAASGIYALERVQGIELPRLRRWFRRGTGVNENKARVLPELQAPIEFHQVNLMERWPVTGPVDLIFCRNVVIYFDKPTQRRLFQRFADVLGPDGHLIIGHSETLYGVSDAFDLVGRTIYRKSANPGAGR